MAPFLEKNGDVTMERHFKRALAGAAIVLGISVLLMLLGAFWTIWYCLLLMAFGAAVATFYLGSKHAEMEFDRALKEMCDRPTDNFGTEGQ